MKIADVTPAIAIYHVIDMETTSSYAQGMQSDTRKEGHDKIENSGIVSDESRTHLTELHLLESVVVTEDLLANTITEEAESIHGGDAGEWRSHAAVQSLHTLLTPSEEIRQRSSPTDGDGRVKVW